MAFTIFDNLFTRVDSTISSYVSGTSANVIGQIDDYIRGLMIIFVALWGYALQQGLINEPITDGLRRIIRISLILTLALTSGNYGGVVVDFFQSFPNEIAQAITGAPVSTTADPNLLDTMMSNGFDIGYTAWENAGVLSGDFGLYIVAVIVWLATIIVVAYAAGLILFAKFALAILLAVGPIYITCAMFKTTQRFFENWVSQAVNYGTLLFLTVAIVQLLFDVFKDYLDALLTASAASGVGLEDSLGLLIMAFIIAFILFQVSSIAAGLSGGMALATQGAMSWAMNKMGGAVGSVGALRPRNLAMTFDRTKRHLQQDRAALQRAKGFAKRITGQDKNKLSKA